MKKIKLGGIEVSDYEHSPILLAATFQGSVVWTHLHREIDSISPRRFATEADARIYAMALAELYKQFIIDAEKLIQNYGDGEAIETERTTLIDV